MSMKIWIINHYATPPTLGSSTRHYCLAKELTKYGHEVTIIASSSHHLVNKSEIKNCDSVNVWEEDSIKFLLLPGLEYQGNGFKRFGNMLDFAWRVLQLPKILDEKPDVILGSSVHPFAVWSAQKLAHKYKVPFCFEVRDLWPQTLIDMKAIGHNHPLAVFLRWLEAYLYRKADVIITLLPFAHEYIINYNISPEKIVYLPNGVDVNLFAEVAPLTEKKDVTTLMYLGSHGPANGLDTLIDAAAELEKQPATTKVQWRLIGDGNQKQGLKDKVKELGLTTVKLEDKIPKTEVPMVINDADILLFHLLSVDVFKYGISPNKLFDYLVSQRPIVFGCNARNNPVSEAQAGITVLPENPRAMAEAIRELIDLPLLEKKKMGQRGFAYVKNNHSYENLGQKLNSLLIHLTHKN